MTFDFKQLQDRAVAVLGLGRSGLAAAEALLARGAVVYLSDMAPEEALLPKVEPLLAAHPERVFLEAGSHAKSCLAAEAIVLSPGVRADLPILEAARADGVPVVGEIELAYRLGAPSRIIAVTGTNGKTTTTALLGAIAEAVAPGHVAVGGNIGTPLVGLVERGAAIWVVELSSFQLETIERFRPTVGVFLNFSDDHLDRHGTREAYFAAKKRLFENQTATDAAVLNADDPAVVALASQVPGRAVRVSAKRALEEGIGVEEGWIVHRAEPGAPAVPLMPVAEIRLKGAHNLENVVAAWGAAVALGWPRDAVRQAVGAFHAVEHRIEPAGVVDGVSYYNDSKGTNYDATVKALNAFDAPTVLILGGKDKGGDFAPLASAISERAGHVVLIGTSADDFEARLHAAGYDRTTKATSLAEAVAEARARAEEGGVVLFSPATASFDWFENYEARGRAFKAEVAALGSGA